MPNKIAKRSYIRQLIDRSPRWARKRHKADTIPYKISGRRIYIIPTRFGFIYAFAIFALLLGSMNYSNGLAFLLTFILAAVGFVAMHLTHSNLSNLYVEPMLNNPVFAGENAILQVRLWNKDNDRPEISVSNILAQSSKTNTLVLRDASVATIHLKASQRGYIELDHYLLSTRFPMNLFYAWTVALQPLRCLVYPSPSSEAPEILGESTGSESHKTSNRPGQDDFAGLRDYQWQDSPQHIAWKSYASQNKMLVKQFSEAVSKTVFFDIQALTSNNLETRLSQLCRLILDAEKNKQNYALKLGENVFPPSQGEQHKHNCLAALATYQIQNSSSKSVTN